MPTDPMPRPKQVVRDKSRWAMTSIVEVPHHLPPTAKSFHDVALGRRTIREVEPMSLPDLLALVRFVASRKEIGVGLNRCRSRRISVSAGALHPIDVLIVSGPDVAEPIIYSDIDDVFGTVLPVGDLSSEVSKLESLLPNAKGHLLLFTGDLNTIDQAYTGAISLLWRDAGAMLQSFAFAAAAYNFAFVPLGSLGTNLLNDLSPPNPTYSAVATALIGVAKP